MSRIMKRYILKGYKCGVQVRADVFDSISLDVSVCTVYYSGCQNPIIYYLLVNCMPVDTIMFLKCFDNIEVWYCYMKRFLMYMWSIDECNKFSNSF